MIRLLDCVDRAQRLPIVVLVARSASLHLAELLSRHVVAGADGLQRAALDYERAIWARASLVVGRTPQQVETMRAVARAGDAVYILLGEVWRSVESGVFAR